MKDILIAPIQINDMTLHCLISKTSDVFKAIVFQGDPQDPVTQEYMSVVASVCPKTLIRYLQGQGFFKQARP